MREHSAEKMFSVAGISGSNWSRDGTRVVSVHDREVRVWNVESGEVVGSARCGTNAQSVLVSSEARRFTVGWGIGDGRAGFTMFDLDTCEEIVRVNVDDALEVLAFSPDSKTLLVAHKGAFVVYSSETGKIVRRLELEGKHVDFRVGVKSRTYKCS